MRFANFLGNEVIDRLSYEVLHVAVARLSDGLEPALRLESEFRADLFGRFCQVTSLLLNLEIFDKKNGHLSGHCRVRI